LERRRGARENAEALIDRLNREVNAATGSPEVRKRLQDLGVEARGGTPEALRDLLVSEIAKWKAVIERAKTRNSRTADDEADQRPGSESDQTRAYAPPSARM